MLLQNKHKTAMYKVLAGILRDPFLTAVLGFKGGTACYFFHGLPRFSVDLDFDIISKKEESSIYNVIHAKVRAIVEAQGLDIRDEYVKRNTIFFLLSYEKGSHNLKIEISRRDYPNTYELKDFYGLSVNVMVRADMFAHKLVAATERRSTASRDFFDIHFFFREGWSINEDLIKLRTGKSVRNYLPELCEFMDKNLSNRNILQGMGELLDAKQKSWVKAHMKDELRAMIAFYLDELERSVLPDCHESDR